MNNYKILYNPKENLSLEQRIQIRGIVNPIFHSEVHFQVPSDLTHYVPQIYSIFDKLVDSSNDEHPFYGNQIK